MDNNDLPMASTIQVGSKRDIVNLREKEKKCISSPPITNNIEYPSPPITNNIEYPSNIPDAPKFESSIEYQPPKCPPPPPSYNDYNNGYQSTSKLKYHIMDIFWLMNEKIGISELGENEAKFITFSYNIDFGNIRVNFYDIPENAIYNNVVFNNSLTLLGYCTLYPASCFKVLNCEGNYSFTCMEQLVTYTGESWQKERPIAVFKKSDNMITLTTTNPINSESYYYEFIGWQKLAFEKILKFTYEDGLQLRGINLLKK